MRIQNPMILDEFSHRGIRSVLQSSGSKGGLLSQRSILIQNLNGIRGARSNVRSMIEVYAHVDFVAAVPVFLRKLVRGDQLKLLTPPRPAIEVISAIAFRRNQHIVKALTVGVAVKPGVLRNGAEDGAGAELVPIRETGRNSFLIEIVRRRLGN